MVDELDLISKNQTKSLKKLDQIIQLLQKLVELNAQLVDAEKRKAGL